MTAPPAIVRLQRIAAAACAGRPLEAGDAAWLAGGLARVLQDGARLDAALGLRSAPGQRAPATVLALARRDALIREAVARFFPGRPAAEQARLLSQAIDRYAATAWRREREANECPARHSGTIQEFAWSILRTGSPAPGERRIRQILAATAGNELAPIRCQPDSRSSSP